MNLTTFSRRGYVQRPTPLYRADRFSEALGGKVTVWIKRDDLLPGAGGGNKTRKLDFALGKVMADGHDAVITCGAPQSNHCRLTLSWAAREGIDCHLVLEERIPGSYDENGSGNILLYRLLGAKSITVVPGGSDMAEEMNKVADMLRDSGKNPCTLPVGASNAHGTLGYCACVQELQPQLFQENVNPEAILVASGSAGTQAGLVAGVAALNMDVPVYGFSVGKPSEEQSGIVSGLANEVLSAIDPECRIDSGAVVCDDRFIGPGYSLPTPEMVEAVTLLAQTEAILLDPVYTGKAMAGLIDYVRQDRFNKGGDILFIHTGGAPGLYVHPEYFASKN